MSNKAFDLLFKISAAISLVFLMSNIKMNTNAIRKLQTHPTCIDKNLEFSSISYEPKSKSIRIQCKEKKV